MFVTVAKWLRCFATESKVVGLITGHGGHVAGG